MLHLSPSTGEINSWKPSTAQISALKWDELSLLRRFEDESNMGDILLTDQGSSIAPEGETVPHPGGTLKDQKTAAERQIILSALERNDWHITNTAAQLGLADHSSLLKIMRRHGLKK